MKWSATLILLVALVTVMAHATDVRGQERTLDLSVGRIVFDYAPAATPAPTLRGTPSHASVTFRESRSAGTWMMASAAVPTADDAMAGMHQIWDTEDYPIWKMFIEENLKRSRQSS